jgi:hypothetical protein
LGEKTKMLVKAVSRKSFLDVLQARGAFERTELDYTEQISSRRNPDEIQLVWADGDAKRGNGRHSVSVPALPQVIVVGMENRRDFLAWVWTYLAEFRPLTAYTRVLDIDELRPFLELKDAPQLENLEEACLGLILAEAATYHNRHEKRLTITPLSCVGTCSHAMARALALSQDRGLENYQTVASRWMKARDLTKQQQLRLKPEGLALPWRVLLAIYNNQLGRQQSTSDVPDGIYATCLSMFRDSEIDSGNWDRLTREYPRLRDAKREMTGPREGRVLFFEQFLISLAQSHLPDSSFRDFLCGFLASQIGPGTLDYLQLLMPQLEQFPTALLWYGLCSGLQRRSSLYGFAGGLGRRVLREIIRKESVFDSPQADIALSELEVLTASDTAAMDFRTGAQGILAVEILPLVVTTVRWPSKQIDQAELFSNESSFSELRELTVLLDELRKRMSYIQNRISQVLDEQDAEWKSGKRHRR